MRPPCHIGGDAPLRSRRLTVTTGRLVIAAGLGLQLDPLREQPGVRRAQPPGPAVPIRHSGDIVRGAHYVSWNALRFGAGSVKSERARRKSSPRSISGCYGLAGWGAARRGWTMGEHFEEMSRALGRGTSRRGVLKMMGTAVAAATAATVLRPFRGDAQVSDCETGQTPCGETCCPQGKACANASTGQCACKAGLTPCGPNCCPRSLICANADTGRCGCNPTIMSFCGDGCCNKTDTCSDPSTVTCCCKGQTPCGTSCCNTGVPCLSVQGGICGCPKATTPCGSGASMICCPRGKACTGTPDQPGCYAATTGQGQGPGYATACSGSCIPCSSGNCANPNQVCVSGCCRCITQCSDPDCDSGCDETALNCCNQLQ